MIGILVTKMNSTMESVSARRTADVEIAENIPFSKMLLSDHVLAGLNKCNFLHPSPIQLRAIPIGCCGLGTPIEFDFIVEHFRLKKKCLTFQF